MATRPIDDHLTLDDKFGRIGLLHDVYGHIRTAKAPCVIGIHGDWGSGKSSFVSPHSPNSPGSQTSSW